MLQLIVLCTFCIWKAKFLAFHQPASRIDELKTTDIDLLGSKNTATAEWKCTCVRRRGKTALIRRLSSVLLQDIVCRGETRGRAGETEGEKEKKRKEREGELNGGEAARKKRNAERGRWQERERDIFSGAVREGDIMEHNWECVCVCAAEGKRELVFIKPSDGGGMFLTHKGVTW